MVTVRILNTLFGCNFLDNTVISRLAKYLISCQQFPVRGLECEKLTNGHTIMYATHKHIFKR